MPTHNTIATNDANGRMGFCDDLSDYVWWGHGNRCRGDRGRYGDA